MGPVFDVYDASAGSGKTFLLAREYLVRALGPFGRDRVRQQLALTFTNKAVGEMKHRILDNLAAFRDIAHHPESRSLFDAVRDELGVGDAELSDRARVLLPEILHRYSGFEVSTIDRFNHRLIRAFARELEVPANFEVLLHTDELLEEAVGLLLERAGNEPALTRALVEFALDKIEDDRSWDIGHDLMTMGKLLFQENHASPIAAIAERSTAELADWRKRLAELGKTHVAQIADTARSMLATIAEAGFDRGDFPRGTLLKDLEKLASESWGSSEVKRLLGGKSLSRLDGDEWLNKKSEDRPGAVALRKALSTGMGAIFRGLSEHRLCVNAYRQFTPLALLGALDRGFRTLAAGRGLLPIRDFDRLLAEQVRDQPVPFIYERIGERYRHYYIDEFQDTSVLQWQNLVPLAAHALEGTDPGGSAGSLLIVGDAKQAIYRWRGGWAGQFLDIVEAKARPFQIDAEVHGMGVNWRSDPGIVAFNNAFFASASEVLEDPVHRALYRERAQQKAASATGGYVCVEFLGAAGRAGGPEDPYPERTAALLREIRAQGWGWGDIGLLVRENAKGKVLAEHLLSEGIPVVSAEALMVASDPRVEGLEALLRLWSEPSDRAAAHRLLSRSSIGLSLNHQERMDYLAAPLAWIAERTGLRLVGFPDDPYALCEAGLRYLLPEEGSPAHLDAFLDLVFRKGRNGTGPFLETWASESARLSVSTGALGDAVRILSVHRSKGLEFPVVVHPYADGPLDRPTEDHLWVDGPQDWGVSGPLLLKYDKVLAQRDDAIGQAMRLESAASRLDALNVLYVALTRAAHALFVLTDRPSVSANGLKYADLFHRFLTMEGRTGTKADRHHFGTFAGPRTARTKRKDSEPMAYTRPQQPWASRGPRDTRAGSPEAAERGTWLHHALSGLDGADAVERAAARVPLEVRRRMFSDGSLERILRDVATHPGLSEYFGMEVRAWNEREIVTASGRALRPDRVVELGQVLTVLEYKTGAPAESHRQQVLDYVEALEDTGSTVSGAVLVYVEAEVELEWVRIPN